MFSGDLSSWLPLCNNFKTFKRYPIQIVVVPSVDLSGGFCATSLCKWRFPTSDYSQNLNFPRLILLRSVGSDEVLSSRSLNSNNSLKLFSTLSGFQEPCGFSFEHIREYGELMLIHVEFFYFAYLPTHDTVLYVSFTETG